MLTRGDVSPLLKLLGIATIALLASLYGNARAQGHGDGSTNGSSDGKRCSNGYRTGDRPGAWLSPVLRPTGATTTTVDAPTTPVRTPV